jgi:hypothetical protein
MKESVVYGALPGGGDLGGSFDLMGRQCLC